MSDKLPTQEIGKYTRYNNGDGSMTIYRDLKFIGAIENTTASCDIFYRMGSEIQSLESQLAFEKVKVGLLTSFVRMVRGLTRDQMSSRFKTLDLKTKARDLLQTIKEIP